MARRFSDIDRGGELKYALDNYTTYKTNMAQRQTKRIRGGTGTAQPRVIVMIYPFSVGLLSGNPSYEAYLVRMTKKSFDATGDAGWGRTKAGDYFDATPAETAKAIDPPTGFSAARMTTFQPTGAATTINYVQSKFTKLYYPKKEGISYHYPIGRLRSAPGTGDERQIKDAIKRDLVSLINTVPGRRVSFKDEKMGGLE